MKDIKNTGKLRTYLSASIILLMSMFIMEMSYKILSVDNDCYFKEDFLKDSLRAVSTPVIFIITYSVLHIAWDKRRKNRKKKN